MLLYVICYILKFVSLCNLFLRYVLLLYYMLVLFSLSGASYCTVYLFSIPVYTIVRLNILLLLCIYVLLSLQLPVQFCLIYSNGFSFSLYSLVSQDN